MVYATHCMVCIDGPCYRLMACATHYCDDPCYRLMQSVIVSVDVYVLWLAVRLVEVLGAKKSMELLYMTEDIEAAGGLMTAVSPSTPSI